MSSSSREFEDYKTQIVKDFHAKRFKEVHERTDEMIKKFGHSWFTDRHIFYALYFSTDLIDGYEALRTLAYNVVFVEKYPEALEDVIILPIACEEAHHKGQSAEALAMLKDRKPYLEKKLAKSSDENFSGTVMSQFANLIEEIENKCLEDSLEEGKQLLEALELERINKESKKEKNRRKKERRKERKAAIHTQHAEAKAQEAKVTQEEAEEAIVEVSLPMFEQPIIIEMGPYLSICVERKDPTGMFHGRLISHSICVEDISLIPVDDNDVFKTYKRLQEEREDFILKPSLVIDGSTSNIDVGKLFLVSRMCLITHFFKEKHKNLIELGRPIGFEDWWTHIEGSFKKVFRNVVMGMLILFPRHHSIGNQIFVCQNMGILIPKPKLQMKNDVRFFMHMVHEIINIHSEISGEKSQLPRILKNYLEDLKGIQWNASASIVDIQCYVDCHYFWNVKERITFLRKLNVMARAHRLFPKLDDAFSSPHEFGWISNWRKLIQPDTRYSEIIQYLIEKCDEEGEHLYIAPCDIIRFIDAVFQHYNDDIEDVSEFKTEEQLERDLSEMFPELYEALAFAVHNARQKSYKKLINWEELLSVGTPIK